MRWLVVALLIGCSGSSEKSESPPEQPRRALPAPVPGALVGTPAPDWILTDWQSSAPLSLSGLRGRVVVVRFWTNTCPHCERSMPALQKLSAELAAQPVTFVGAYHSKPKGSERPWKSAVEMARKWGVTFPIAYDRDWKTVQRWWLATGERRATSATFVIDKRGQIVHVHPGPVFFPSDAPGDAAFDADYQALRSAVMAAARKS